MRTVKWNPVLAGTCMMVGGVLLWAGAARADVTTTNPSAILIYPKLVVDVTATTRTVASPSGLTGVQQEDTLVELTNTSPGPVNLRCFLVNANGHCSQGGAICDPQGPTQPTGCGSCTPGWLETDFSLTLTGNQPIAWRVSDGIEVTSDEPTLPCDPSSNDSCRGQFSNGSIPPANEIPLLRGELKCIEVDGFDSDNPLNSNDIKGEATIERFDTTPAVDIEGYNAIGIQAAFVCHGGVNDGVPCLSVADTSCADSTSATPPVCGPTNNTLVLGGTGGDYNGCPNVILLDSFFDGAVDPTVVGNTIHTHLTLVPCTENFNLQSCATTVVQYLVFNEFEQRLSTSNRVTCFSEVVLSDIDTHPGTTDDKLSIFNVALQGTLTGQTQLRSLSEGLVGIAQQFEDDGGLGFSAALNLHERGIRSASDVITLSNGPGATTP
ncbi:MAG: hypothetical protein ACHQ4J_12260 [Candidatus Binatia bacterium]